MLVNVKSYQFAVLSTVSCYRIIMGRNPRCRHHRAESFSGLLSPPNTMRCCLISAMLSLHFCSASVTADKVPDPRSRRATRYLFQFFGLDHFLLGQLTACTAYRYYLIGEEVLVFDGIDIVLARVMARSISWSNNAFRIFSELRFTSVRSILGYCWWSRRKTGGIT